MRLIIALVVVSVFVAVCKADEPDTTSPPLKIDKNLRRALLKALEDLEAESAETLDETSNAESVAEISTTESSATSIFNVQDDDRFKGASITFEQFNNDDVPSEDKLQNSTYIESDKYDAADSNVPSSSRVSEISERVTFQKYNNLLGDKSAIRQFSQSLQTDQHETRSFKMTKSGALINSIGGSSKSASQEKENIDISSSNGIASVSSNSLLSPSPTVQSPTTRVITKNITASFLPTATPLTSVKMTQFVKPKKSEVNIFKAPLVAAFTVQQDESGVPKSVVPIYKPDGDGQALTLQEQLEFKQKLLEKQLAELQAQQIQQTQFLIRQQELYQEQQRQKQRQSFFLQEQARLKQLEEQRKQQQQQQQQQQQLQQQQQQQLQQQQQHRHHIPQQLLLQQPLGAFTQNNLALQLPLKTPSVQFQPSVAFQAPTAGNHPPFQSHTQEQLRLQHQRQHLFKQQQVQPQPQPQPQQQQYQHQFQRQQPQHQDQKFQQSFSTFPAEFQPPVASSPPRFHRQEAFGTVGNAGINTNNPLTLEAPRFSAQSFVPFNQFNQFSPIRLQSQRPSTPANQIQQLLFQSGIARDLGNNPGSENNQEDLNIVSKVLAWNVGSLPIPHNFKYTDNNFGRA